MTLTRIGYCGGLLLTLALASCAGPAASQTPAASAGESLVLTDYPAIPIAADLLAREIRPGFFVVTHSFPWPHNSLLVEMQNGDLTLVDTPYTPEATQSLLAWVEGNFGERRILAVNTGFHYDNLGGNGALFAAGIPIYGSEAIPAMLAERGDAVRALTLTWLQDPKLADYRDAHETLEYLSPDNLFPLEEGLVLSFGDELLEVFFTGPSHTPENVVAYFPERRILFGGCMILAGDAVGNAIDADMGAWPNSVERLRQFETDLIIPGHGDRMDTGLIDHTLDLLAGWNGD